MLPCLTPLPLPVPLPPPPVPPWAPPPTLLALPPTPPLQALPTPLAPLPTLLPTLPRPLPTLPRSKPFARQRDSGSKPPSGGFVVFRLSWACPSDASAGARLLDQTSSQSAAPSGVATRTSSGRQPSAPASAAWASSGRLLRSLRCAASTVCSAAWASCGQRLCRLGVVQVPRAARRCAGAGTGVGGACQQVRVDCTPAPAPRSRPAETARRVT